MTFFDNDSKTQKTKVDSLPAFAVATSMDSALRIADAQKIQQEQAALGNTVSISGLLGIKPTQP